MELEKLKEFIGAADLYLTPYLNEAQITSGTLAYTFGAGKAVVSTPYWHAAELLADGRGVLVPFGDAPAIAREVIALLKDDTRRHAMRKNAYKLGRDMIWSNVAQLYMASFERARLDGAALSRKSLITKTLDQRPRELPDAEARPPGPDDRLHRRPPARDLQRSQLLRGLLYRRQRSGFHPGGAPRQSWERTRSACGPWAAPAPHSSITPSTRRPAASTTS